jgi:hypothetical protein
MTQAENMRLLAAILLLARAVPAADLAAADYFPPDTKVVIGIEVKGIIEAVVKNFGADSLKQGAALTASGPLAGFDPTKDLEEVLIATSGQGDHPPTLMVLRGRFDLSRMGAKAKPYHDVQIIEDPQKPGEIMALLDGSTALAGDVALVHAAIDRKGGASPWTERIGPLRTRYAVWGIGEGMEGLPAAAGQGDTMKSLDRFDFGAAFSHGLDLTAALHFRSPEEAQKMGAMLGMMKGAMAPNGTKFNLETANGTMRISVQMTEEEIKKAIETQKDALAAAVMSKMTVTPVTPKKPESKEGKIVTGPQGDTVTVTLPEKW